MIDEGLYGVYDTLEYYEVLSLFKSNSFTRVERQMQKAYLAFRSLKELLPVIAAFSIVASLVNIFYEESEVSK